MFAEDFDFLVFDLDGTLVDTAGDIRVSLNHALETVEQRPLSLEAVLRYVGNGAQRLIERSLEHGGHAHPNRALVERVLTRFLEHYSDNCLVQTRLYPQVAETLRELDRGPLAVLTNKPVRPSRRILRGLHILDRFWRVEGGDSAPAKKPAPDGLLRLVTERGVRRERTLLIGDTAVDVLTAKAAGTVSAGVTYGFRPDDFAENPPDFVLDSLADLLRP